MRYVTEGEHIKRWFPQIRPARCFEGMAGAYLPRAVAELAAEVAIDGSRAWLIFNGVAIDVRPGVSVQALIEEYHRKLQAKEVRRDET